MILEFLMPTLLLRKKNLPIGKIIKLPKKKKIKLNFVPLKRLLLGYKDTRSVISLYASGTNGLR